MLKAPSILLTPAMQRKKDRLAAKICPADRDILMPELGTKRPKRQPAEHLDILNVRRHFHVVHKATEEFFQNRYKLFAGVSNDGMDIVDWDHPLYAAQSPQWLGEMKCGNDVCKFYSREGVLPGELVNKNFVRISITMPVASFHNSLSNFNKLTIVNSPGGTNTVFHGFTDELVSSLSKYIRDRDGGDDFEMIGYPHPIQGYGKTLMEKGWPILQMTSDLGTVPKDRNVQYITFFCLGKDLALYMNVDYNLEHWTANGVGQHDFMFKTRGLWLQSNLQTTFLFDNRSLKKLTIQDIPLEFYGFSEWTCDECALGCINQRNHAVPNRMRYEKIGVGKSQQLRLRLSCKSCPDSLFKTVGCAYIGGRDGVPPIMFNGQISKTVSDVNNLYCTERVSASERDENPDQKKFVRQMNLHDMDVSRMDNSGWDEVTLDYSHVMPGQSVIVTVPEESMAVFTDSSDSEYTMELNVGYNVQVTKWISHKRYKKNGVPVSNCDVKDYMETKFNKMLNMDSVDAMFVFNPDDKYHSSFANTESVDNGAPGVSNTTRDWATVWGDKLMAVATGGADDDMAQMGDLMHEMKKDKKRRQGLEDGEQGKKNTSGARSKRAKRDQ